MKLKAHRDAIDRLDERLVKLLNRRAELALRIGRCKQKQAGSIYVPAREKTVLANVHRANAGPLSHYSLTAIYREIMSACQALEKNIQIAFLGPLATYSHQAARRHFGGSVHYIACETIADIFNRVRRHEADYGVIPVENSTDGSITHTLDLFVNTPLKICAELYLPISHCLMSRSGRRADIRRVLSKPEVFAQCRDWLQRELPGVELAAVSSTARAAEMVAHDPQAAAIAARLAAEPYGLKIIASNIQDLRENMTRFLVIAADFGGPTGNDKTSLMFALKHQAGSLHRALESFHQHNINMTKIESRPNKQKAWEYLFFVDIEGHAADAKVSKALAELERHCLMLTVLGAYPRAKEGVE